MSAGGIVISISSQQQDPARIVHCSRRNGLEREAFKRQPLVRLLPHSLFPVLPETIAVTTVHVLVCGSSPCMRKRASFLAIHGCDSRNAKEPSGARLNLPASLWNSDFRNKTNKQKIDDNNNRILVVF